MDGPLVVTVRISYKNKTKYTRTFSSRGYNRLRNVMQLYIYLTKNICDDLTPFSLGTNYDLTPNPTRPTLFCTISRRFGKLCCFHN